MTGAKRLRIGCGGCIVAVHICTQQCLLVYCNGFDQCIVRQRLRKHGPTRNNRTTGVCNPFLGNGLVNTLPRRCNGIIATVASCHVRCVFCRQQPARQWIGEITNTWHVFSVLDPYRGVILKRFGATTQLTEWNWRVEVSHGKFVVEDELEVGLWKLNVWFEGFMYDVEQWYWECVI
jgi:hypothetical protein